MDLVEDKKRHKIDGATVGKTQTAFLKRMKKLYCKILCFKVVGLHFNTSY